MKGTKFKALFRALDKARKEDKAKFEALKQQVNKLLETQKQ